MPGEDEPLHALVTASSPEDLKKGMDKVILLIMTSVIYLFICFCLDY